MIRGFQTVEEKHKKHPESWVIHPTRGDAQSAGYDFYSPADTVIQPGEKELIFTDIKAYMQPNEFLMLLPRSSQGKHDVRFANTAGVIDASYYSNPGNDGNIGIYISNGGNKPYEIKVGERIGQGIFVPFLLADNDVAVNAERTGGFGSTGV